jgi:hypothetical protein
VRKPSGTLLISLPRGFILATGSQPSAGQIPANQIRDELARLQASPLFARAESQRRLLEYIVESTLAGDPDRLKEYTIAVAAMGRPPSFDPKIDPAIRVEVRRLRSRLASFLRRLRRRFPPAH